MLTLTHMVDGEETTIHVPETYDDLDSFSAWLSRRQGVPLALDTETTGTEAYSASFKVRTVQIGDTSTAWVIPIDERSEAFIACAHHKISVAIAEHTSWTMHNAPYDILALDRQGLLIDGPKALQRKTLDTFLAAHLRDPRAAGEDNAVGHGLKALSSQWVDLWAADTQSGLTEVFRKDFKLTKAKGWAAPMLTFHETYLRYAGLDVIYTSRLRIELLAILEQRGLMNLLRWEHRIQSVTLGMEARGILVDVDYTEKLVLELHDEAEWGRTVSLDFGVENINSTQQVADALVRAGVKLTSKTPSGKLQVNSDVLLPLAGMTPYWTPIEGATPHPLAEAIVRAKRADKWRTAYVEAFLNSRDSNDRVHPGIKSLAARTGRMSVVAPPLQQLPAGDWRIRRCLIADPGNVFISSDFSQIELRAIAANAGVKEMISAIETGQDLHDRTASLVWADWAARAKDDPMRKKQRGIAKNVAFGYAYGAGPAQVSKTAGISYAEAKAVIMAFERAYPELAAYSDQLQREASSNDWLITTAFGRQLPVSPNRGYAALNYGIQSTARDLFAEALLRVDKLPGLSDRLSLVIHDEILHQAPRGEAVEQAAAVRSAMQRTYRGVPIDSDSEIGYGGSWGSFYGVPRELDRSPEDYEMKERE